MDRLNSVSPHNFHIPVMGICFSIDTPLKVSRYGISSVISIVDDELIEHMREFHSQKNGIAYEPINKKEHDARAKRITAYLDLLKEIISTQVENIKNMSFIKGNDLMKYFELLPDFSSLKNKFNQMMQLSDGREKDVLQNELRNSVSAGSIDVNIMAKLDNAQYTDAGEKMPDEYSDAHAAIRGFANSSVSSSVIISAGYNPKLFNYCEQFQDFYPTTDGRLRKKIVLKVSDYRSAMVQGKILAKKGIWVSEFRIESGLNCGGHAFPTEGLLLGPILEEFKNNRAVLASELWQICNQALTTKDKKAFAEIPEQRVTVQGGVGTKEEHEFLMQHYSIDSVGWGSPFLLVPEVTNVEDATLNALAIAKKDDYYLSNVSPLGVPFNNFKGTSSDAQRLERIRKKRPGSPCHKKFLSSNTEFTEHAICTSSRQYLNLKEKQIRSSDMSEEQKEHELFKINEKDCLCEGLNASVRLKEGMYLPHKLSAVAICPGPNLAYFSGTFSLKEMVGHIYGRLHLLNSLPRPHVFLNEFKLYLDYIKNKALEDVTELTDQQKRYYQKFKNNLCEGVEYYKSLAASIAQPGAFLEELSNLELQLQQIFNNSGDASCINKTLVYAK